MAAHELPRELVELPPSKMAADPLHVSQGKTGSPGFGHRRESFQKTPLNHPERKDSEKALGESLMLSSTWYLLYDIPKDTRVQEGQRSGKGY